MYKQIARHESISKIYSEKLIREGTITKQDADQELQKHNDFLEKEFEAGSSYKPNKADWLDGQWSGLKAAPDREKRGGDTSVKLDKLMAVSYTHLTLPTKSLV